MDCKNHAFNTQLHKDIEKEIFEEYCFLSWGFLKPVSVLNRQKVSASGTILFSYIRSQKGKIWAALKTWVQFTQSQLAEFPSYSVYHRPLLKLRNWNYAFIEKSFHSPTCYSTHASCQPYQTCHLLYCWKNSHGRGSVAPELNLSVHASLSSCTSSNKTNSRLWELLLLMHRSDGNCLNLQPAFTPSINYCITE